MGVHHGWRDGEAPVHQPRLRERAGGAGAVANVRYRERGGALILPGRAVGRARALQQHAAVASRHAQAVVHDLGVQQQARGGGLLPCFHEVTDGNRWHALGAWAQSSPARESLPWPEPCLPAPASSSPASAPSGWTPPPSRASYSASTTAGSLTMP